MKGTCISGRPSVWSRVLKIVSSNVNRILKGTENSQKSVDTEISQLKTIHSLPFPPPTTQTNSIISLLETIAPVLCFSELGSFGLCLFFLFLSLLLKVHQSVLLVLLFINVLDLQKKQQHHSNVNQGFLLLQETKEIGRFAREPKLTTKRDKTISNPLFEQLWWAAGITTYQRQANVCKKDRHRAFFQRISETCQHSGGNLLQKTAPVCDLMTWYSVPFRESVSAHLCGVRSFFIVWDARCMRDALYSNERKTWKAMPVVRPFRAAHQISQSPDECCIFTPTRKQYYATDGLPAT